MARKTVYNTDLVTTELWAKVNKKNKRLLDDFLAYCESCDKSPSTRNQYWAQLRIFFCWNYEQNEDKFFVDIRKRDFIVFFGYGRIELKWSPNRLSSFRAVLSSLSNYIERVLDDEFPNFRNIVKVLEPIKIQPVREKTVLEADEVEATIEKLVTENEYQKACWLALLYSSGMRKAEALQMKVDFFKPENIVFDIMYRTPKIRTKGAGKAGKQVPRYVFTYTFDKYLKLWLEEREKLGITNPELFVVKRQNEYVPAGISTFNSWAQWVSAYTGLDIYAHSFRHLWVSNLKRNKYPDGVIQKLQNWANPQMVSVYNDMTDEEELQDFFGSINSENG